MSANRSQMPLAVPQSLHLGLTGYPLGHSLSPRLHRAALSACGLSGEYQLYPVPPMPEGAPDLVQLLSQVRAGAIHGLNVTIPHKQSILEHLDELTPAARAIGAVNTVYTASDDRLVGDNTDAPGFMTDLDNKLRQHSRPRSAIVLGAGGSARAVIYALLRSGWQVAVAARRLSQASALVASFQPPVNSTDLPTHAQLQAIELSQIQKADTRSRFSFLDNPDLIIVNTTPVGMAPHPDSCPWPVNLPFPREAFVYDLVYNPPETKLVRLARSQGIRAASGLGMLVEQAALAFERWTGVSAPREAMQSAVSDYLLPT